MIRVRRREQDRTRPPLLRIDSWMFPIAIASLIITLFAALLGLSTSQDPKAEVTLETISETNVFDLRRPLQDLNILFRDQDVEEQNLNLRIVTIKVANTGTTDILAVHYDLEDDWGIKFNVGEVIEARLVDANSDYLRSKIVPQKLGTDTVGFPKVIFEEGDFFALEVLLLHLKNETPLVSAVGKIAGIKEIKVLAKPLERGEANLFARLFPGSPLTQVIRAIIYFIGSLIAIIVALLAIFLITESFKKLRGWKRRKRVLRTRTIRQMHQPELRNFLVTFYELGGDSGQRQLQEIVRNPQGAVSEWLPEEWDVDDQHQDEWISAMPFVDMHVGSNMNPFLLHTLFTKGFVEREEGGNIVVDQALVEAVGKLSDELNI